MKLMEDYARALQAIYDEVGFKEDWVVYPIDDRTEMYWKITNEYGSWFRTVDPASATEPPSGIYGVMFNENRDTVIEGDGEVYEDEIYTQRFYPKHVYRGKNLTLIFVDTHTDGNKFFAIFDNAKEVTE
jgi:hypothetical protein